MFKNIKLFCFHQYGLVTDGGHQYCSKCGKARFVRVAECQHVWYRANTIEHSFYGRTSNYTYVMACEKCGELKNHKVKS